MRFNVYLPSGLHMATVDESQLCVVPEYCTVRPAVSDVCADQLTLDDSALRQDGYDIYNRRGLAARARR